VEVAPGDVRTRILTETQRAAAEGAYCQALAAFLHYLARDYDRLQAVLKEKVLAARERATKAHSRTPGIVADLQAGFELALDFAVSAGVIDSAHSGRQAERCWIALNQVAREQRAPQDASEPAHRFVGLLRAALAAGKAHVALPNGGAPPDDEEWGGRVEALGGRMEAWGWRMEDTGEKLKYAAKGVCTGWIDGANLYLEPTVAYAVAQDFGRSTGEPLAVSEIALKKRLREKGLLATVDEKRETLTIRRTLMGAIRPVLHFNAGVFLDDGGFPPADVGQMSGNFHAPDTGFVNGSNNLQENVGFVGQTPTGASPQDSAIGGSTGQAGPDDVVEI
jgi:hypothetical protein